MNWRKWILPALIVPMVAAAIVMLSQRDDVAPDLAGQVAAALAAGGQSWTTVSANARDVVVSGTAPTPDARQAAVRIASGVAGVRSVSDNSTVLPLASPYVWAAQVAGRQVTLSGNVPTEGARAALLAGARRALPQSDIVDRMSLARGAPAVFSSAAAFALSRLAGLSEGAITLTDAGLDVSGTAADAKAYAGFTTAFQRDLPASVSVGSIDVVPTRSTRFVWSANVDSLSVTTAGNVPNDATRQAINATLKATFAGVPLVDGATVASGDPPGFAEAATFAAGALGHLKRGGVTLDGVALAITGDAKSVDDYAALLDSLAQGIPEGIKQVSADITPAAASPYVWQGDVADGKATLNGYAPSLDRRGELATLAKSVLAGLTVEDRIRVAKGEPRIDWVGAVKFAMGELALLSRGSVSIADSSYSISGDAKDDAAYAMILDQNARSLPAGLTLKAANVTPPRVTPYRFVAERRDGAILVAGFVARSEDRQAILAAARRVSGADVSDNLVLAGGAPSGFIGAATAAVRSLARLAGGKIEITDQAVTVTGTAYQAAAVNDIADGLRDALPTGFTLATVSVLAPEPGQPLTPAGCRDQLQTVLKAGRIEFDASNPVVTTDSLGVLDRVSATLLRCPQAAIEVGVHSDNDGAATMLRDRTQARADAIVDYLVRAGVKRERLTAVGYGGTKPVADNATDAGKAANRRVEFAVAVPSSG